MLFRLKRIYNKLQGSLWFVPALIVVGLMLLSFLMIWLDRVVGYINIREVLFIFTAGPEGTRDMLTTIAGSMLTVASVAFSFTIVVFSFASSQYGSRTIHSFMDDNTNQAVLGTLLGSFVYCLLILRTVRLESGNEFVPVLASSVALTLAVIDLGLFILYIHHVSEAIQAYHIINRIGITTSKSIDTFFPRELGGSVGISENDAETILSDRPYIEVPVYANGYVEAIDIDYMLDIATRHELFVIQRKGMGDYVIKDEVLAIVGPESKVTPAVTKSIQECYFLGVHRSLHQDPEYGLLLLSDITLKALSAAINDPNTAIMGLNEISRVLRQIARKEFPKHILSDKQGKPRIIASVPSFEQLAAQAFDQVRRYGMADSAIPVKMLEVITEIGEVVELESERVVLREHVIAVAADANTAIRNPRDRAQINAKLTPAMRALKMDPKEIQPL